MINKASQLLYVGFTTGQKVDVPLVSLSCLGAKDTTQNLWETLVSLLKKCCCHKIMGTQLSEQINALSLPTLCIYLSSVRLLENYALLIIITLKLEGWEPKISFGIFC